MTREPTYAELEEVLAVAREVVRTRREFVDGQPRWPYLRALDILEITVNRLPAKAAR